MDRDTVVATDGLSRSFGDVIAVDGLSLNVQRGEVFGFLGHNGAGKTTTVRLLNGLLTPTAGTASVLGLDPSVDGPTLRRHTGVLTETPSLDERLPGRDNLLIYAELYGLEPALIQGRVDELLEAFELTERKQDKVSEYSKGMKQRLALARALLHQPQMLFLDEPTGGLDPVAASPSASVDSSPQQRGTPHRPALHAQSRGSAEAVRQGSGAGTRSARGPGNTLRTGPTMGTQPDPAHRDRPDNTAHGPGRPELVCWRW